MQHAPVEGGSGNPSDVDDVYPHGTQSCGDVVNNSGGGDANVSSHHRSGDLLALEPRAVGFAYGLHHLRGKLAIRNASNVVLPKNMLRNLCHESSLLRIFIRSVCEEFSLLLKKYNK